MAPAQGKVAAILRSGGGRRAARRRNWSPGLISQLASHSGSKTAYGCARDLDRVASAASPTSEWRLTRTGSRYRSPEGRLCRRQRVLCGYGCGGNRRRRDHRQQNAQSNAMPIQSTVSGWKNRYFQTAIRSGCGQPMVVVPEKAGSVGTCVDSAVSGARDRVTDSVNYGTDTAN